MTHAAPGLRVELDPMRRWNGWGDAATVLPVPREGRAYLEERIGPSQTIPDQGFESCLRAVPPSRLAPHALITTDPAERLCHARGQSLPDWVALRYGRLESFPDGVAYPTDENEVRLLLRHAAAQGIAVIPYGGGTSVVGHINPERGPRPTLTIDLSRMARLFDLDETSRLATFEAGCGGPAVEAQLGSHGYTLGHYPQSFECSTLGGWIATRSTGQQSLHYGRIESLFAGGHLETPSGPLELPAFPASAAGPDLRQLVLGCEGRLGVITRATVRVRPRPAREVFRAFFFHSWQEGIDTVRQCVQAGTGASMLRLNDPVETEVSLALSGRPRLAGFLRGGLRLAGYDSGRCLLIAAETADPSKAPLGLERGLPVGRPVGDSWRRARFLTPYLRNSLWEAGYALDTLETAAPWSQVGECSAAILSSLADFDGEAGERTLAFAHLSHVYPDGASIYATFLFRRTPDPDETLERWRRRKAAATEALQRHGGTISHQHGVGVDHAAYLAREKGPIGIDLLRSAIRAADPGGIMNPGKLLPAEGDA